MNRESVIRITYFMLRVVVGLLYLQSGSVIVFGWFGGSPGGRPPLMSQMGIGGLLETVGGALIALGLLTRPIAFILAGEMAVAYFQFHQPNGAWPLQNQGIPAVLFCFIFLFMAAKGGGDWSLDKMLARKHGTIATTD